MCKRYTKFLNCTTTTNNAKHCMKHMHCNVHKNAKLQNKTNYNEHEG